MIFNIRQSLGIATHTIKEFAYLTGAETNLFTSINDIDFSLLDEKNILYGSVQDILYYLSFLNKEYEHIDYPFELHKYCNRYISQCYFKSLKKNNLSNVFCKPTKLKQFNGFILSGEFKDFIKMATVNDNDLVWLSTRINLLVEYRVFIYDRQILDVKPYKGDCSLGFCKQTVLSMIQDYKNQPVAYAIDIGVNNLGQTVLVEVNDGFSLGSYGLTPVNYGTIIVNRWRELIKVI